MNLVRDNAYCEWSRQVPAYLHVQVHGAPALGKRGRGKKQMCIHILYMQSGIAYLAQSLSLESRPPPLRFVASHLFAAGCPLMSVGGELSFLFLSLSSGSRRGGKDSPTAGEPAGSPDVACASASQASRFFFLWMATGGSCPSMSIGGERSFLFLQLPSGCRRRGFASPTAGGCPSMSIGGERSFLFLQLPSFCRQRDRFRQIDCAATT